MQFYLASSIFQVKSSDNFTQMLFVMLVTNITEKSKTKGALFVTRIAAKVATDFATSL